MAHVVRIDGFEVTVEGVQQRLDVTDVVGLRHGGQKARFQVAWVGHEGTAQQGQIGLRALELQKDIFGVAIQPEPAPARSSSVGSERRSHPRISCQGSVKFRREGADTPDSGALKLLSEGGCYIETAATAPPFSHLDLIMFVDGVELQATGKVLATNPGFGMGIEFAAMNPAYRARLHEWTAQHCKA
jgi:hypothetical protein